MDTVAMRLGTVTRVTSLDARADAFTQLIEADLLHYYAIAAAMLGDAVERVLRTLDADHIAVVVLRYEGDLSTTSSRWGGVRSAPSGYRSS